MLYFLKHEDTIVAMLNGVANKIHLKKWLKNRSVPVTRIEIENDLHKIAVKSAFQFMLLNNGLSLADHYWIQQVKNPPIRYDIYYINFTFLRRICYRLWRNFMHLPNTKILSFLLACFLFSAVPSENYSCAAESPQDQPPSTTSVAL